MIKSNLLVDKLLETIEIGKISYKHFTGNRKTYYFAEVFEKLVTIEYLKKEELISDFYRLSDDAQKAYKRDFTEYFTYKVLEVKKKREASSMRPVSVEGTFLNTENLTLGMDLLTSDYIILDKETKKPLEYDANAILKLMDSESRKVFQQQILICQFEYDPYKAKSYYLDENIYGSFYRINMYQPPKWFLEYKDEGLDPDKELMEFFEHFYPDPKCREYGFYWIYNAITSRNETYLVHNGAKGIGKGLHSELLRQIVGFENATEAQRGFLDSNFNKILDKKRLLVLDELSVDDGNKVNRLKSYINEWQTIEAKNVDAEKPRRIFINYVITNNNFSDMRIEYDDRRFSVMDVTDENLAKKWSHEKIDRFKKRIEKDTEFIAKFCFWILRNFSDGKYHPQDAWRGKRFHTLVYESLYPWQKHTLDTLRSSEYAGKSVSLKQLRSSFKDTYGDHMTYPESRRLKDFLRSFRFDGELIGEAYEETTYPRNKKVVFVQSLFPAEEPIEDEAADEEEAVLGELY